MEEDLKGRIALVTGGSRGIGRASALALAKAGANVPVNFQHNETKAQEVCSQIKAMGCRALSVQADVSVTIHLH
jgi:3-oxoacyl-[acyl-carrier protein] reductase